MPRTTDTPRARQLGAEISDAREAAGIGVRELARRLGVSHTTLIAWQKGDRAPTETELAAILGVVGVTGTRRDTLLELARDAGDPNWIAPGVDRSLAALIGYEQTATSLFEVHLRLIPGLLQTSDFARSIMLAGGTERSKVDNRVLIRMGRRDVLTRPKPVQYTAVIGEEALLHMPCSRSIAVDQLHFLNELGARDNVTIQVLRTDAGYSPALEGAFVLANFAKGSPVIQHGHYRSTATITDQQDVRDYQDAVATITRVAMSPEQSAGYIAQIAA